MLAGGVALCIGNYPIAQSLFERALSLEMSPNVPLRFVGALTMLGLIYTRRLEWDTARKCHSDSIERLRGIDHIYRAVFTALSACGFGEIELRDGTPEMALTRFRHALRLVKERPLMVGNLRLRIRAQAGMSAAYAALSEREKAEQHLSEAISRLSTVEPASWTPDTALGQLYYSIASAQLRMNLPDEAISSLNSAIDTGFADAEWLATDPEWIPIRDRADYLTVVERVRLIPSVNIEFGRFPPLDSPTANFQLM